MVVVVARAAGDLPVGVAARAPARRRRRQRVRRGALTAGEKLTVTLTVRNTGTRSGSEVVQLYVHDEASTLIRPPQELKAFAKVTLQPGEAQTVSLTLGMRAFAAYDDVRRAWVAEAGRFEVRLGASSADIRQRAWVTLSTEWVELVNREPTRSTIRA